jgi:hypothetical protein
MRDRSNEYTVDDFVFMSFMRGAKLIHKQLTDKRLTSNRYVADRRWMADLGAKYDKSAENDVTCWFHIPIGTKNSISLELWAEDCEKMGLNWEIRQHSETHWTVFLMLQDGWLYNKQIRSFSTIHRQHSMTKKEIKKEIFFNGEYWEKR